MSNVFYSQLFSLSFFSNGVASDVVFFSPVFFFVVGRYVFEVHSLTIQVDEL